MVTRRLIISSIGLGVLGAAAPARAAGMPAAIEVDLRGAIDASAHGVRPGGGDRKSKAFARLLEEAAAKQVPVFLPPGDYVVSNVDLPDNTRLTGVPGATRILYGGDGYLFACQEARNIRLENLVLDGGNRWLDDTVEGLVHLSGTGAVTIENCEIKGSSKSALYLERCGGRICPPATRCSIVAG